MHAIQVPDKILRKDWSANFFIGDSYARFQRAKALHIHEYDDEKLEDAGWVIIPEAMAWLRGRTYTTTMHHKVGFHSQFMLHFDDPDDAVLFKLTWGGA